MEEKEKDGEYKYRFQTKKYLKYWDAVLLKFRKEYNIDIMKMIATGKPYEDIHRIMMENNYKPITETAYKIYREHLIDFNFVADNIHQAVINFLKDRVSFIVNTETVLNAIITAGFADFLNKKKPVDLNLLLRALEIKLKYEKEGIPEQEALDKIKKLLEGGENGDKEPGEEKVFQTDKIFPDSQGCPSS